MINLDALTIDEREIFHERAAILEYEAGKPRGEAEAQAYQAIIDARPAGLMTGDPLLYWIAQGIRVIGAYPTGAAIASGEDYPAAFTTDPEDIKGLREGLGDSKGRAKGTPINRFRFIPGDAELICFDLDRGHADGGDGIKSFYALFKREGLLLPDYLADIERFPCHTRTPSGGVHLHFKYTGTIQYKHQYFTRDVEVFHFGNTLTAPGSRKESGDYRLYGTLDAAPILPPIIERRLTNNENTPANIIPRFTYDRPERKGPPSLDMIADWAIRDGNYNGKNRLCFEIARRAARTDYEYTAAEVESYLQTLPQTAGHKQIRDAVQSAFKGKYERAQNA